MGAVTADDIRKYLLWLQENGHNPGGVHGHFRALRAFCHWCEQEFDGYVSPIRKIKSPRTKLEPLPPVPLEDVKSIIETCDNSFTGIRDKAFILCLLDTGMRAQEILALKISDIEMVSGAIRITNGKGGKSRTVYIGRKARRAIKKYLSVRKAGKSNNFLWCTHGGWELSYSAVRGIIKRRAAMAGVKPPPLHSFRRAFALSLLRSGVSIYVIQNLLGHSSLHVLSRYLKIDETDLQNTAMSHSPVDRM